MEGGSETKKERGRTGCVIKYVAGWVTGTPSCWETPRRQSGAQASGSRPCVGSQVFTAPVCLLTEGCQGEQEDIKFPKHSWLTCASRAGSRWQTKPSGRGLQEVRLGWQGRHGCRYWQHQVTHVHSNSLFSHWLLNRSQWMNASSRRVMVCSYFFFYFLFLLRAKFLTGVV